MDAAVQARRGTGVPGIVLDLLGQALGVGNGQLAEERDAKRKNEDLAKALAKAGSAKKQTLLDLYMSDRSATAYLNYKAKVSYIEFMVEGPETHYHTTVVLDADFSGKPGPSSSKRGSGGWTGYSEIVEGSVKLSPGRIEEMLLSWGVGGEANADQGTCEEVGFTPLNE